MSAINIAGAGRGARRLVLFCFLIGIAKPSAVSPEAQVKLQECFKLEFHPLVCEGLVPVRLWLCTPDGKRLANTCDWPHWKAHEWPKQKAALLKKFPSVTFA